MSYKLWIENGAKDEIKKLPGHMRQRIRRAIAELAENPYPYCSKQMKSPEDLELELELMRIRIDAWRVIYAIDKKYSEIGVLAVRKRPPYDYSDLSKLLEVLDS